MTARSISHYHVHVYCTVEQIPLCQSVRTKMLNDLSEVIEGAGPVRNRPVGPHPLPMFEAWFGAENLNAVYDWMTKNRENLSVMFHPLSGNDYDDHAKYAKWIGQELPLNLKMFDELG